MGHVKHEIRFKFIPKLGNSPEFTFTDWCAGIGGMRLAFENLGGECVFSSEWNKYCQKTYYENFGDMPHGDITKILTKDIPNCLYA